MLVLSRKAGEKILIPSLNISIEVVEVQGGRIRLGIEAPRDIQIVRAEIATKQTATTHRQFATAVRDPLDHAVRNKLNTANLVLALAQQQLQAGQIGQASDTLRQLQQQILAIGRPADTKLPSKAADRRATVLVVDDDRGSLELLANLVRAAGFEVATASDGVDALNYLQRAPMPQLMLLDMMMPRCDGMTTVRIMRRNPVFDQVKVFAVSGHGPGHFGVVERAAGIDGWFQKPIDPEKLMRELKQLSASSVEASAV